MDVRTAKAVAREWVAVNRARWPGLRAAHLVGGITAMADADPFPREKDVDLHLVFAGDSPMLQPRGPFATLLEEDFGGVLIEAGLKPEREYASPEAVLANPEIAHHLTLEPVLFDPDGLLCRLQAPVRREYARRPWVQARLQHERNGLAETMTRLPISRQLYGATMEINLLGYTFTYITAALAVANLQAPSIGGRMTVRLRDHLAAQGRLDLYHRFLDLFGIGAFTPAAATALLAEGAALFDRAVAVARTPHPFGHKMHAHLRPYLVGSCQGMIDEGNHREALPWTLAFALSAVDILIADGNEADRAVAVERRDWLLAQIGLQSEQARDAAWNEAEALHAGCFALADAIAARHSAITD